MTGGHILLTGGAGFIGSHLAERLLADGRRVVVYDDFNDYYDPSLKRRNVEPLTGHPNCRIAEGDIRDAGRLEAVLATERCDAVVHLAARAGVRPSMLDPELYVSTNVDGTLCVLQAARRHGVKRFVFGSSSSVYGNNVKIPFAESDPVDRPISPYAATKKAGEVLCHVYHHLYGMRIACLRFFTVYGPRQRPEMAIQRFATLLSGGAEIEQFGDGSSARDYTYVSDIVEGIVRALERATDYHVWNLGGSRVTTLGDLVHKLAARLSVEPRVRRREEQPGDVDRTWADISLARRDLDWEPAVDIDRGLDLFATWFEGQPAVRAGRRER